jgi:hypothetical protein
MLKKGLFVAAAAMMIGCGGSAPTNSSSNSVANTANTTVSKKTENSAPANAATNAVNKANAAVKPAASGPQRISFAPGKSDGTVTVKLGPNASKQFVVGAKTGQILMIDADSFETKIRMVKGKVATEATLEEPGHYDTTLLDDGDFVFEVKNTQNVEMVTVVKVVIGGGR